MCCKLSPSKAKTGNKMQALQKLKNRFPYQSSALYCLLKKFIKKNYTSNVMVGISFDSIFFSMAFIVEGRLVADTFTEIVPSAHGLSKTHGCGRIVCCKDFIMKNLLSNLIILPSLP